MLSRAGYVAAGRAAAPDGGRVARRVVSLVKVTDAEVEGLRGSFFRHVGEGPTGPSGVVHEACRLAWWRGGERSLLADHAGLCDEARELYAAWWRAEACGK